MIEFFFSLGKSSENNIQTGNLEKHGCSLVVGIRIETICSSKFTIKHLFCIREGMLISEPLLTGFYYLSEMNSNVFLKMEP